MDRQPFSNGQSHSGISTRGTQGNSPEESLLSQERPYGPSPYFEREFLQWNLDQRDNNYGFPDDSLLLQVQLPPDPCASDSSDTLSPDDNPQSGSTPACNGFDNLQQDGLTPDVAPGADSPLATVLPTLACPEFQDDSDTVEVIDLDSCFYGLVTLTLLDVGHPEIWRLHAESKTLFDQIPSPVDNEAHKAEVLYNQLILRNSPIFLHYSDKGGLWLIPAAQTTHSCAALIAYLMWRLENRWTMIGVGREGFKGALFINGPLSACEQILLQNGQYPYSLAYFGRLDLGRKQRLFQGQQTTRYPNIESASASGPNQSPLIGPPPYDYHNSLNSGSEANWVDQDIVGQPFESIEVTTQRRVEIRTIEEGKEEKGKEKGKQEKDDQGKQWRGTKRKEMEREEEVEEEKPKRKRGRPRKDQAAPTQAPNKAPKQAPRQKPKKE